MAIDFVLSPSLSSWSYGKTNIKNKLGNQTMYAEMLKCQGCGKNKDILMAYRGKFYCDECYFRANPPRLTLVEFFSSAYEGGSRLFNQTNSCYEDTMTVKMFQTCGWFLRRKREKSNLTTYDLEYFGEKQCIRCGDVKFPRSFAQCFNAALCRFTARKTTTTCGSRAEIYLG